MHQPTPARPTPWGGDPKAPLPISAYLSGKKGIPGRQEVNVYLSGHPSFEEQVAIGQRYLSTQAGDSKLGGLEPALTWSRGECFRLDLDIDPARYFCD